jgi:7-cyano-7-deazaguanine synthase
MDGLSVGAAADGALVLFSGGQDSGVCLAWALENFAHVETVGFDYGQRHRVELACRVTMLENLRARFPHWAAKLGPDHIVDMTGLAAIAQTSLTIEAAFVYEKNGLPNSFVPGRNLLFFGYAAAIAYRRDLKRLVGGMCETDYSGYPDCRDDTLKALQVALSLGLDKRLVLETPLMWIDKAATWALAEKLGGAAFVDMLLEDSHSCYAGERNLRHAWGYGCGVCPACELRKAGFAKWRADSVS